MSKQNELVWEREYDRLCERLAQTERDVAAQRDLNQGLAEGLERMTAQRATAERERDEWKRKHANLASGSDGLVRQAAQYRDERDAALADLKIARHALGEALAKAEEWEKEARRMDAEIGFGHERENALREKAEAAEAKNVQVSNALTHWQKAELKLRSELTEMRARIEALANGWYSEPALQQQLRAILTPPKAETALDVLTELEDLDMNTVRGSREMAALHAKLRKLLEEGE